MDLPRINALESLAFRIRAITSVQLPDQRKMLRQLAGDGLLHCQSLPVRVLPHGPPLYSSDSPTDLDEVVSVARSRFDNLSMRTLNVYSLAQRGANYFGLKARRLRLSEVEHDLAIANVWLALPDEDQKRWQKEDLIEDRTGVVPDAWLGETAHEFVGSSYRVGKVERLVRTLENSGKKVVLW